MSIQLYILLSEKAKDNGMTTANGNTTSIENGKPKSSDKLLNSECESLKVEKENVIVTLHDITMSLKTGTLLGVCGSVGSGKTSVIQAILGVVSTKN